MALGCRVSRAEVDALASELGGAFEITRDGGSPDVVVVNTCAITADAEAAARRAIRRAALEHPRARIVAAGCQAEVRPDALASLPGVAAVVGARSQGRVASVVARLCAGRGEGATASPASAPAPGVAPGPARHTRPFLKVQDGCDRRCAYCIVPLARGPSRSRPFEEVLRALALLGEHHAEVVLTGVHLGAYGRDLAPRTALETLLREAVRRRLVRRLRLSSIEPGEFPRGILREREGAQALCPHFHLPLQSGSPRVLEAMRRPGAAGDLRRAVEEIAAFSPGACLGTDVLAGFPGETEADHRETVALVESLPLAYLHVFPFSPRPGTPAAGMKGAVPAAAVKERVRELLAVSERKWRAYLGAQVGRELEVVAERVGGGFARGTAERYVTVRWPSAGEKRGEVARVVVLSNDGKECLGVRAHPPAARPAG
jgi:threonylcarbamoyladenosine tRNA methylthiotransferase MtaB